MKKATINCGWLMFRRAEKRNYNADTIKKLKGLKIKVDDANKKHEVYDEWCCSNMRITVLEREFFRLYSEKNSKSFTSMFRKYIQVLMRRNPDTVELAKKYLDGG